MVLRSGYRHAVGAHTCAQKVKTPTAEGRDTGPKERKEKEEEKKKDKKRRKVLKKKKGVKKEERS